MRDLTLKVLGRVKAGRPGAVFTTKAFGDLGKRAGVDQALSRLARAGKIRRLSRGVYDFPKTHPTLGSLSPDPDSVAKAIADQAGHRLQPTPARAANALGLSSQVPAQIVYLTDGSSRKIKVGNQVIRFKHAGPKALLGAGTHAGVALQAIRAFGPDQVLGEAGDGRKGQFDSAIHPSPNRSSGLTGSHPPYANFSSGGATRVVATAMNTTTA